MCLITKFFFNTTRRPLTTDSCIQISTKDKYVFKIFKTTWDTGYKVYSSTKYMYTPYQGYKIESDGVIMSAEEFGFERGSYHIYNSSFFYVYEGIHAHTSPTAARDEIPMDDCFILKCLIPAGTPYIISKDGLDIVTLLLIVPPITHQIKP